MILIDSHQRIANNFLIMMTNSSGLMIYFLHLGGKKHLSDCSNQIMTKQHKKTFVNRANFAYCEHSITSTEVRSFSPRA